MLRILLFSAEFVQKLKFLNNSNAAFPKLQLPNGPVPESAPGRIPVLTLWRKLLTPYKLRIDGLGTVHK
jgi:hypothetical protein